MNYIIEPSWIYWINVLPTIKLFLWIFLVIVLVAAAIIFYFYKDNDEIWYERTIGKIQHKVEQIQTEISYTTETLKEMKHCHEAENSPFRIECTTFIEARLKQIKGLRHEMDELTKERKSEKLWLIVLAIVFIFIVLALIFIPSKETMIEMFVAKNITPANLQVGKGAIIDLVKEIMQAINGG